MPDPTQSDYVTIPMLKESDTRDPARVKLTLEQLRSEMLIAAEQLDFERAAALRDQIHALQGTPPELPRKAASARRSRRK
jgi:excinuclease UvrABC helicase subunit UvrB